MKHRCQWEQRFVSTFNHAQLDTLICPFTQPKSETKDFCGLLINPPKRRCSVENTCIAPSRRRIDCEQLNNGKCGWGEGGEMRWQNSPICDRSEQADMKERPERRVYARVEYSTPVYLKPKYYPSPPPQLHYTYDE